MKINTIQIHNPYLEKSLQIQKPKAVLQVEQSKKILSKDLNKGILIDMVI